MQSKNIFVRVAMLVVLAFFAMMSIKVYSDYQTLKVKRDALQEQVLAAEDKNAILKNRLAENADEEYIIRIAREKLDLHLPEEIVFYNDLQ